MLLVTGFTMFFVNARVVSTGQPHESLQILIDVPFMLGIWFLGLPYLVWMLWKHRERLIGEQVDTPKHADSQTF
jgi:hypothetical protein